MKILMIEQGGRGGVADYTDELAAALADAGIDLSLATACDHEMRGGTRLGVLPVFFYLRGGTPLRDALRTLRVHRLINGAAYLLAIVRLLPTARRLRIVHFQAGVFPPLVATAFVLMRAAGAAIVFTPHNTFNRGMSWHRSRALCQRLAARIIVHAEADLPNLTPAGASKASVIPHGDYTALAEQGGEGDRVATRIRLGIPLDAPVALVFGQLRTDKGIADVLAAARRLPELHVIVAGSDAGAGTMLRDQSRDADLAGRLHLSLGFQPIEAAAHWFAAADVSVLAYHRASQSGVLLLSYAYSRPVVVYPVGGLPEAVVHGVSGWITEAATVPALADTLTSVIRAGADTCSEFGRAGATMARDRFGWPSIARITAEVYRDALGSSHAARYGRARSHSGTRA